MKLCRLMLGLLAIALLFVSCQKRTESDSETEAAKLRPEVAAASKGASPIPGLGDTSTKLAPSSSVVSSSPR